MFDQILRPLKDAMLKPLLRPLGGLAPMAMTGIGFLMGLIATACAALGKFPLALLFWILNRLCDGLDGALAREQGKKTDLGGYLDILSDFFVYASLPLGIMLGLSAWDPGTLAPSMTAWPALASMLAAFYLNAASWMYLSGLMEKKGMQAASPDAPAQPTSLAMPPGIAEGFETILLYSLMLVFPAHFELFCWIMVLLTLPNLFIRILVARKLL